jgi:XTP/dITP diphosphohydrolase
MRLIIASNNPGKRSEIARILRPLDIEIVPDDQTIFVEVVENGRSFAENAEKKAVAFSRANALPALADDSGLVVDALAGLPGIRSSRYAGAGATDTENNHKLLRALSGCKNRKAYFECTLHLAFPDGRPAITANGKVEGRILEQASGRKGFGYDPLFYCPELGKTFAEASPEEKAGVSHRGRALKALITKLKGAGFDR